MNSFKVRVVIKKRSILCMLLIVFMHFTSNVSASTKDHELETLIRGIYEGVGIAAYKYEQGNLSDGMYMHKLTEKVSLSFSSSSYDKDISRAFALISSLQKKHIKTKAQNKISKPKALSRMERLMQAERTISRNAPQANYFITDYDVMNAFKETRKKRIAAKNFSADGDIQAVISERQVAEQELINKKERQAVLQEQASAWQAQLDQQAVEQASVMREWKKQNGFGAHVRRIFTGALGAGISSFTGGLTSAISNDLANKAIDKILN